MFRLQRIAPRVLQGSSKQLRQPTLRRAESSHTPKHHDPASASEGFGTSFYIVIGSLLGSVVIYNVLQNPTANPITVLLAKYSDYKDTWQERNALHTKAEERAAHDRNLFNYSMGTGHIELACPEAVFNNTVPRNVPAGQSPNLEKLFAHYREKQFNEEEEKRRKFADVHRKEWEAQEKKKGR